MAETKADYQAGDNELPPIEYEKAEPQPGTAALWRIIEAIGTGQEPAQVDVAAARAVFGTRIEFERAVSIEQAASAFENDQLVTAWERIAPLLKKAPPPITDWGSITAPDRTWLIKDWLPAGRIGMLSGTGGAGKSLLALQLAMAIASGEREWLGRPGAGDALLPLDTDSVCPVVYAGYEDEPEEIRRRLGWIDSRRGGDLLDRLDDRLAYAPMAERGPVWAVAHGQTRHGRAELTGAGAWLRSYCREHGAQLLVIDPMAAAYGADENDNAAAAEFIANWGGWATSAVCAVLLVHHLSKAEALSGEGEGYRGASAWQGGMRYFWRLQGDTLTPLKMSYARLPEPVCLDREKADAKGTWQLAADQTPEDDDTSQCGAETAKGTPCRQRGNARHGGRCSIHAGQPVMNAGEEDSGTDTRGSEYDDAI